MRDLLIMAIVLSGSAVALRKPWIGIILWTWISLMNPHTQWGYSSANWPVAMLVAVCALIGAIVTKDKQNPFMAPAVWILLLFTIWITVTLPFSFHPDTSFPLWERSMKIFLMLFVTLSVINTKEKLDWYIWIIVASIGFYGVKGGLFTILTGGSHRVWGPGGFIGGNNEIALAVILVIPLMRYLQLQMTHRWARHTMTAAMLLSVVMALGTHSRGALLTVVAMGSYLWLRDRQKFTTGATIILLTLFALPFMPEQWWSRMETIKSYDEDSSAMGRINAWEMAWNLAKDRFFGGGFDIYDLTTFGLYAPNPLDVHAAHSIYFQILGEHGFIGLFIFLLLGVLTWNIARNLIKASKERKENQWVNDLGAMAQASMVGYAVGGAFLSLAYFDLPYNVMVVLVLANDIKNRNSKNTH